MSYSPLVTIQEVKTGKTIKRRPVDASELVGSGAYKYVDIQPVSKARPPQAPRMPQNGPQMPPQEPQAPNTGNLPELTENNSKAEIMAALAQYGVQHRANMDKDALLAVWNDYVASQSAK